MKENDVASIAEQFGLDKSIVEASIEDGTLGQRIKDALSNKVVYDKEAFDTFQANHKKQAQDSYYAELVEKAKKGDMPHELYAPVKGAAYQQLERELAKKYGVDDYSDVQDLIDKVVTKSANTKNVDGELAKQIEELKKANITLKEEKENAIKTVEDEYRGRFISREKSQLLSSVPFDFSGLKADEVESARAKVQKVLQSVFDAEYRLDYDDNNNLVVKKGDDIIKNQATLEPVSAKDVFINLAKEYNLKLQSPDTGGQGGKSSGQSQGSYGSVEEFEADMEARGIKKTDPRYVEAYSKSGLGVKK